MAMMRRNCSHGCCLQGSRAEDKRVTQKWLDEYESKTGDDMFMCPRDGLPCTCNRIEC